MRETIINSTNSATEVKVVVDDTFTTSLYMPHDIIPEQLAMQIATSIAQIPCSYERHKD